MCHFEGVEFHCKTVFFWGGGGVGGATTQEPIKKRHSVPSPILLFDNSTDPVPHVQLRNGQWVVGSP